MASSYPGGLDSLATNKADSTAMATDHKTHHNDMADAINKLEAELGTNPSGATADVATRIEHRIFNVAEKYGTSGTDIANAFTDAATAGGGIIELNDNVSWSLSSTITFPALSGIGAIHLGGRGQGTSKLTYTGTGYAFQLGDGTATDARGHYIRDLWLAGNGSETGLISFNSTRWCGIEHCRLTAGSGGSKILVYFNPGAGSIPNYFGRIVDVFFDTTTAASDIGLKLHAVDGTGANSNYVYDSHFGNCLTGVLIDGGDTNRLINCDFASTMTTGVLLQGTAILNKIVLCQFDAPTTAVNISAAAVDNTVLLANSPATMVVSDSGTNTMRLDIGGLSTPGNVILKDGAGAFIQRLATAATTQVSAFRVAADTVDRFLWKADGTTSWGPGNAAVDTNLKRAAQDVLQTDDQFIAVDGVRTKYLSGAGKTTVVDGDFTAAPGNGTVAVHYDTTGAKAYISVRANGVWKVMAGPI
jgi:hypothetical protein